MKFKYFCIGYINFLSYPVIAQNLFNYPKIKTEFTHLSEVVPNGWELNDTIYYDFNSDKKLDILIILKYPINVKSNIKTINYNNKIEEHEGSYNPKITLLAIGDSNKNFKVVNKYTQIFLDNVLSINGNIDPFTGLKIKKKYYRNKFSNWWIA